MYNSEQLNMQFSLECQLTVHNETKPCAPVATAINIDLYLFCIAKVKTNFVSVNFTIFKVLRCQKVIIF